jgi:hypothetical protein
LEHYVVRDPNISEIIHRDVDDSVVSNWIMGERTSTRRLRLRRPLLAALMTFEYGALLDTTANPGSLQLDGSLAR